MLRIVLLAFCLLIVAAIALTNYARAEEIHFNNNVYILKYSALSPETKGYENEYFLKGENRNNRTQLIGIYYYPEINKPIKFADERCKEVENNETDVLLKFIENKKVPLNRYQIYLFRSLLFVMGKNY